MTPAESLPEYLRALRGSLTQEEAAKKVGEPVTRVDWNRWENDKRGIGELNAQRIAAAFGRPLEEVGRFVTQRGQQAEIVAVLERLEARVARLEQRFPQGGAGGHQALPVAEE